MTRFSSHRMISGSGVSWSARGVAAGTTTDRWRDKRAHIAPRTVGCFSWVFRCLRHIAQDCRNVSERLIFLFSLKFVHIAGFRHD